MQYDPQIRGLAQLHVMLAAPDDAIGLDGEQEHVLGRDDGMGLGVSEAVSVHDFWRRGVRGLEHVHPYLREPVASRHQVTRSSGRPVHTRPYVSRVEDALHRLRQSRPAHFARHQAALVRGAVKSLRDPKVSKGRKAAIAAALALFVGAMAFPLLGPLDDVVAVGALRAATSPGRPHPGRAATRLAGHVHRGLGGHMLPPPSEMMGERRLAEARRRRMAARGGAEWTRARAEELALEEGLFGVLGAHVRFNPNRHPRDRTGKFAGVLGDLGHGDTAHLPGGVAVTRTRHGYLVRHRRDLAPDVDKRHIADPLEAARQALQMDPTPRENDRIEGVRHREGAPLSKREVHTLAPGTAVVASGEYGRFQRVEHDTRTGKTNAVVEFDHPTEDGRTVAKRLPTNRVAIAHAAEDPAAADVAEKLPESPGRSVQTAAKINPAGDMLHFLDHVGEVLDRQNEASRRELDARIARSMGRPSGARHVADPQLRRAGIVPSAG